MRTSLQMQIFIVGLLFLRSRLVFNIGPLESPTSRGEFETKPGRNLENQGASFPPGKNRNNHSAIQARFMRNETITSCFSPGFSSTSVHPGNNSRKVHVSFLPIFRVSTSSLPNGRQITERTKSQIFCTLPGG